MITRAQITDSEYHEYYSNYLNTIDPKIELIEGLRTSMNSSITFFTNIPTGKLLYRYEEGKWTIKEILQHLIDSERIFSYRVFRFGRGDKTPLASMDQNIYINPSRANEKSISQLLNEYAITRQNTLSIVESLTPEDFLQSGVASGYTFTTRAVAFIILGHELWHKNVILDRYLS